MLRTNFFLAFLIFILLFAASCKKTDREPAGHKKLKVITTLFVLYDIAREIGKDRASVTLLFPPGAEAHSFEPRPGDIRKMRSSDILVYTGRSMEPWIDKAAKGLSPGVKLVDSSTGVTLLNHESDGLMHHRDRGHDGIETVDPHFWLDFDNTQIQVENILNAFIEKDPENREFYVRNAGNYCDRFSALDRQYRKYLSACRLKEFVHSGHYTLGYLTKKYGLRYYSAYRGLAPDAEPTPQQLASIIKKIRKNSIKYIYYEEIVSLRVAQTLSAETGAEILKLHTGHNVTKEELESGVSFIYLMEKNLENLKRGLECS